MMATVDDGPLHQPSPQVKTPAWQDVRVEASGSSPAAAVAELSSFYAGQDWSARTTGRPFEYRYTAVGNPDVTLRRSRLSGAIRGAVPPTNDYIVQWLTAGHGTPDVLQDRVPMTLNMPMLIPTDRTIEFEYDDFDQRLVHLSRRLVHDTADELGHTAYLGDLGLDHLRPLDPAAITSWRDSLSALTRELRDGAVNDLLRHTLTRETVVAFLRLYPPRAIALPREALVPRRVRLRAAVEYIHDHIAEPLQIPDIAAAAGFSIRATQEMFKHSLGLSPLHYVQQVRLDRVRRELLQAEPRTVNIGDVAKRWGFAHPGRFSASYQASFGEYPSTTLRR